MRERVNTGGLKSFEHNNKGYSSKEEEERYERLGKNIYRAQIAAKQRRQLKWIIGIGTILFIAGVIYFLFFK